MSRFRAGVAPDGLPPLLPPGLASTCERSGCEFDLGRQGVSPEGAYIGDDVVRFVHYSADGAQSVLPIPVRHLMDVNRDLWQEDITPWLAHIHEEVDA